MQIQPLFDRVLLEPITLQTTTGGLLVQPSASERGGRMKIISLGPAVTAPISIGETVFVHRHAGVEIGKFYLVKEIDILAKEVL